MKRPLTYPELRMIIAGETTAGVDSSSLSPFVENPNLYLSEGDPELRKAAFDALSQMQKDELFILSFRYDRVRWMEALLALGANLLAQDNLVLMEAIQKDCSIGRLKYLLCQKKELSFAALSQALCEILPKWLEEGEKIRLLLQAISTLTGRNHLTQKNKEDLSLLLTQTQKDQLLLMYSKLNFHAVMNLLCTIGANVQVNDNEALINAVESRKGGFRIPEILLEHGANIAARDHEALFLGLSSAPLVSILLKHSADPLARSSAALYQAIKQQYLATLQVLLGSKKYSKEQVNEGLRLVFTAFFPAEHPRKRARLESGKSTAGQEKKEETVVNIVTMLLEAGAELSSSMAQGMSLNMRVALFIRAAKLPRVYNLQILFNGSEAIPHRAINEALVEVVMADPICLKSVQLLLEADADCAHEEYKAVKEAALIKDRRSYAADPLRLILQSSTLIVPQEVLNPLLEESLKAGCHDLMVCLFEAGARLSKIALTIALKKVAEPMYLESNLHGGYLANFLFMVMTYVRLGVPLKKLEDQTDEFLSHQPDLALGRPRLTNIFRLLEQLLKGPSFRFKAVSRDWVLVEEFRALQRFFILEGKMPELQALPSELKEMIFCFCFCFLLPLSPFSPRLPDFKERCLLNYYQEDIVRAVRDIDPLTVLGCQLEGRIPFVMKSIDVSKVVLGTPRASLAQLSVLHDHLKLGVMLLQQNDNVAAKQILLADPGPLGILYRTLCKIEWGVQHGRSLVIKVQPMQQALLELKAGALSDTTYGHSSHVIYQGSPAVRCAVDTALTCLNKLSDALNAEGNFEHLGTPV
jgi:hypothetical protein